MKKALLLSIAFMFISFLSACNIEHKNNGENQKIGKIAINTGVKETTEINSGEENKLETIKKDQNINISTGDNNIKQNNIMKVPDNWESLEHKDLMKILPECELKKLKPAKVTDIDNIVQNCKKEIMLGFFGLNGQSPNNYHGIYYMSKNGEILEFVIKLNREISYTPICKIRRSAEVYYQDGKKAKYIPLGKKPETSISGKVDDEYINICGNEEKLAFQDFSNNTMRKFFQKGLINNIMIFPGHTHRLSNMMPYCEEECKDFKSLIMMKNDNHYIVSSWIENITEDLWKSVYLIDGKLYNPGITKKKVFDEAYDYITESKWHFSNFSGNKAIVKRIIDGEVIKGFVDLKNDVNDFRKLYNLVRNSKTIKYNLETCEIPLN